MTGTHAAFDPASRKTLSPHDLRQFSEDTLFHRLARVLCEARCVPRKELFESWAVASRARRRFKGLRIVDMPSGHGLIAHMMLLLDPSAPGALALDRRLPASAARAHAALSEAFPQLAGRVVLQQGDIADVHLGVGDLVVSAHACGVLTDQVLDKAIAARVPVVVLPCCHAVGRCDAGGLQGWVDSPLAIDLVRAARLRNSGFEVHTQTIPVEITPKNRLLYGAP